MLDVISWKHLSIFLRCLSQPIENQSLTSNDQIPRIECCLYSCNSIMLVELELSLSFSSFSYLLVHLLVKTSTDPLFPWQASRNLLQILFSNQIRLIFIYCTSRYRNCRRSIELQWFQSHFWLDLVNFYR